MSQGRRGGADSYRVISGGAADPQVLAGTVDPSAGGGVAAAEGSIYLLYAGAAGQIWYKTGAAATAWTQSYPGIGTLDQAYDGPAGAGSGRAITADSGAVTVTNDVIDATACLELSRTPGGAAAAKVLTVTLGANATGHVVDISNNATATSRSLNITHQGSGNAINIAYNGSGDAHAIVLGTSLVNQALVVTEDNVVRTTSMVSLTRQANATGHVISISNSATATSESIYISHAGTETAVEIVAPATSGDWALYVNRSPGSGPANVIAIGVRCGANVSGTGVEVTHDGTGIGFRTIMAAGSSRGLYVSGGPTYCVDLQISGATAANAWGIRLGIDSDTASTGGISIYDVAGVQYSSALIDLVRSNDAHTGNAISIGQAAGCLGHAININNSATATARSISIAHAGTASAVYLDVNGNGVAVDIDSEATTANVVAIDGSTLTSGYALNITVTNSMTAAGKALRIKGPGAAPEAFYVDEWGTTKIDDRGSDAGYAFEVDRYPSVLGVYHGVYINLGANTSGTCLTVTHSGSAGSGPVVVLNNDSSNASDMFTANNDGTGRGVYVNQNGSGDALSVYLNDAALAAQALVVTEDDVARTTSIVSLSRQTNATGHVVDINNSATATSQSLRIVHAGSANSVYVDHNGTGTAVLLDCDVDSTAYALEITREPAASVNIASGLSITMGANTSGSAIDLYGNGSGAALYVDQLGVGESIYIDHLPGAPTGNHALHIEAGANLTGNAIYIRNVGSGQAIHCEENDVARAASMVFLERQLNATGHVLDIDNNATATARSINVDHEGSGNAVHVAYDGSGDAHAIVLGTSLLNQALVVTEDNVVRSAAMCSFVRQANATGHVIDIDNNATGSSYSINIDQETASSVGIYVDVSGASSAGIYSTVAGTGSVAIGARVTTATDNNGIEITEDNVIRVSSLLKIDRQANATGKVININNDATATSQSIYIDHEGTGSAIYVDDAGAGNAVELYLSSSTSTLGMRITESNAVRSVVMVSLERQANATGHVLSINNAATATSRSISVTHAGTASALYIDDNGNGAAIEIDSEASTADIIAVDGTELTTGDALQIKVDNTMTTGRAIRVLGGAAGATEVFNVDEDGNTYILGKLTVDGAVDPTSVSVEGTSNDAYYEAKAGQSAAVSGASQGRIRYNATAQAWQMSANGAAYVTIASTGTPIPMGYGELYMYDNAGTTYNYSGTDSTWVKQISLFASAGPDRDCTSDIANDEIDLPARASSWLVSVHSACKTHSTSSTSMSFAVYVNAVRQDHIRAEVVTADTNRYIAWSMEGVVECAASDVISLYANKGSAGNAIPPDVYYAQMTVTELG